MSKEKLKQNGNVGAGPVSARTKKQNGITLIALVITIIVMLILVGVSVTVALNGGLFTTAKEAAEGTATKRNEELNLSDGKVEINGEWYNSIGEYVNGSSSSEETTLAAGLYDEDWNIVYTWEQLLGDDVLEGGVIHVNDGVLTANINGAPSDAPECLKGNLVIDNSVTDAASFDFCGGLTSIIFPDTITTERMSFAFCSSLTSITIPDSVTSLIYAPFESCTSLKSITLPKGLEKFGDLSECTNLTDVYYLGTIAEWNSVSMDGGYGWWGNLSVIHCTDGDAEIAKE